MKTSTKPEIQNKIGARPQTRATTLKQGKTRSRHGKEVILKKVQFFTSHGGPSSSTSHQLSEVAYCVKANHYPGHYENANDFLAFKLA